MFRKFWADVFFGTLFIYFLMWGISNITYFRIFEIFDPISDAIGDFELTDIVYSQFRDAPVVDERIVLVNMGSLDRRGVAELLNIINENNPLVIGVDSFFNYPKEDTLGDIMLQDALSRIENLVMVTKLIANQETDIVDSVHYSWSGFSQYATPAFATLRTDAEDQDDLKFCRDFWPQYTVNGERQVALGVQLASFMDSARAEQFLQRNNEVELINWRGNVMDFGASKWGTAFFALDWIDVMNYQFTPDMIEGKIVLFCFLGEEIGDRTSLEDKFITPLNKTYAGRTLPDMYGGVIHANIIAMILSDDLVNYMSDNLGLLLGFILCFINVIVFTYIYKRLPKWYDGITKVLALFEILYIYYLIIMIMDNYNYKVEITIGIVAVALAGDALEVYHGVVKNTFTKEGRRSLFKADKI